MRRSPGEFRRLAVPWLLGASSLLAAMPAFAQPRKSVIMQHGFLGDMGTWTAAAQSLQQTFDANFILTTTGWRNTFGNQANTLTANFYGGAGQDAAFVAHSFGGLLGRHMLRTGTPWRGLITVGTPHQGAPIAANIVNGTVASTLTTVATNIFEPFDYFQPPRVSFLQAAILDELEFGVIDVLLNLYIIPAVTGNAAVLAQAQPGSAFLVGAAGLNGAGAMANEALSTPTRWQMTSVHTLLPLVFPDDHEMGLACRIIVGGITPAEFCYGYQVAATYAMYDKFVEYSEATPWENPGSHTEILVGAIKWLTAFFELLLLDHTWCQLIGSVQNGVCLPSDGLIPASVSTWSGATKRINLGNLAHTGQTDAQLTQERVAEGLLAAQIPRLAGPPAGGTPLSVGQVSGPAQVPSGSDATYSVTASSGQGTLSYVWKVDGISYQSGAASQFTYTNSGAGFVITVVVADGTSSYSRALSVSIGSCGFLAC